MQVIPIHDDRPMNQVEEYQRRLTYKGTVTIPAEVRRVLGVKPNEEVRFKVVEGKVELLPPTMTLESAFGSVTPMNRPEDFQQLQDKALAEHVHKVVSSLRD